ncbi:MAG TPA: hypothetical protein VN947_25505 [Polyangia bacterium]|nr:hypothetical protein [Polyangia bacterium]
MRSLAFASLVFIAAAAGACSAIDDFNKFTFSDGGGVNTDMGGLLPAFGQACVDACDPGPGAVAGRALTCFHMFGSRSVPGGMCTRTCTPGAAACIDYGVGVADCVTVEGIALCLPHCDATMARGCRSNYECCANHNVVTNAGDCAPSQTDLCH